MNMKSIASGLSNKFGRQTLVLRKHSPAILFGAGVVGVVASVVLASRATLKLEAVLDEVQSDLEKARTLDHPEYSEEDRKKDIVLIYTKSALQIAKMYGPAVLVGIAAIGALTSSHVILTRRNTGLMAAYAALDRATKAYQKRVAAVVGEEKEAELRFDAIEGEVIEETEDGPKNTKVKIRTGPGSSPYAVIFDEFNKNWQQSPEYNRFFLQAQQNYANDLLKSRGHVFLNEVYEMLGFPHTKAGAVVGWVLDGGDSDNYISFGVFKGDEWMGKMFVNGHEPSVWLDFNVDGVMYDKLED